MYYNHVKLTFHPIKKGDDSRKMVSKEHAWWVGKCYTYDIRYTVQNIVSVKFTTTYSTATELLILLHWVEQCLPSRYLDK